MRDPTTLQTVWLVVIAALWVLYLVLEGFDWGVGMLLPRVRRDAVDRSVALQAIGPTWAANEVWVVIAVTAMFGAFPGWYAAWSSGLYLPLSCVLVAIIVRNAGVELLGKRDDPRWRARWERAIVMASTAAPFCWGLIWTATVSGLELRGADVVASPLDVLSPYSMLGGLTFVALSRAQGAAFLVLRTGGAVRTAARDQVALSAPVAALLTFALLAWTAADGGLGAVGWVAAAGGAVASVLVMWPRPGAAFAAACAAVGLLTVTLFGALYPAGIGGVAAAPGLSLAAAAAGDYTLTLLTVLAAVLMPLLLAAQAWSYYVFRHRITRAAVGERPPSPVDVVARLAQRHGS
jgi:cytochrome bd ubiquinol oxidase subunit II